MGKTISDWVKSHAFKTERKTEEEIRAEWCPFVKTDCKKRDCKFWNRTARECIIVRFFTKKERG